MMKNRKTIFVIEDNPMLSEIIALQLKHNFNCKVIIFKNGDHLFYNVTKYLPDLIILDYNFNASKLNFNNGLEVLVRLRKDSNVPVVVVSGQSDMAKAIEIVQKGANDYISKDDDDFMNNLLASVKDIFDLRKSKDMVNKLRKDLNKGFVFLLITSVFAFSAFNYVTNI
jgi:two-component system response regulator AtoC